MKKINLKRVSFALIAALTLGTVSPCTTSNLTVNAATVEEGFEYLSIPDFNEKYKDEILKYGGLEIIKPTMFESSLEYSFKEYKAKEEGTEPTINRTIETSTKFGKVDYDFSWQYEDEPATTVLDRYNVLTDTQASIKKALNNEVVSEAGSIESITSSLKENISNMAPECQQAIKGTIVIKFGPWIIIIIFRAHERNVEIQDLEVRDNFLYERN